MSDQTDKQVHVRSASETDLPRVAELFDAYRVFYGQEPARDQAEAFLRERLTKGESAIFVAEVDGRVVGFTQLYSSFSSISLGPIWILNDLYVDEAARGRSVGSALLRRAQTFAAETGASRITLSTARDNRPAIELYQKMGWQPDDYFVHFYRVTKD